MKISLYIFCVLTIICPTKGFAAEFVESEPKKRNPNNRQEILKVLEIGMTFDQVVSKVGQPDEYEASYFIGSNTDAMRFGSYWLISRGGQVLDCVISRRGFNRICSRLGGGCESRNCEWYLKKESENVVLY